jgi:putative membrane protein
MSRCVVFAAAVLFAAFGVSACQTSEKAANTVQSAAQAQATPSLSTTDASFINAIGKGGIAETELGRLAQSHATRAEVRDFGAQMVADHTKAGNELATLAQGKRMTPPADMDLNHKAIYDRLSATSGTEFDRAYMETQVQDHTAVVSAFEDEITNGSDADVKAFAQKYLPVVQHHLDVARTVAAQ